MSLIALFRRRQQLPGRLDLVAPVLRAMGALRGFGTAVAVYGIVVSDLQLGRRATRQRTRQDGRPYVRHESDWALQMLAQAQLVHYADGGWQLTPDGERLLDEEVSDQEVVEIVRAARRRKPVGAEMPIVGLRELPIPPRGQAVADPDMFCCYGQQPVSGGDIKLGYTTLGRIWDRATENDSGSVPLRLCCLFAGGRPTERLLHERFAHLRVRPDREYFRAAPELALLVHAIPERGDKPAA